jgi:AbrB family looped-hinge helix DNA binding protein
MAVVTVSPKFQVVIPREIREALGLEPGQKVQVLQYQNRVEFIRLVVGSCRFSRTSTIGHRDQIV